MIKATRRALVNFGLRVLEERDACGLTQEELSEKIRISARQLQRIEAGRSDTSLTTVFALSRVFRVAASTLLEAPARSTKRRTGRPKSRF